LFVGARLAGSANLLKELIMINRQSLVRSLITSAVLSTVVAVVPAHAGLLGGGGSAVGSLAGGLGPGGANVNGMGMGQGAFSPSGSTLLPRGERAVQSARQLTAEGQAAGQGSISKGSAAATGNAMGAAQAASDAPAATANQTNSTQQAATTQANGQGNAARRGLFSGAADAQGGLLSNVSQSAAAPSGDSPAAAKPAPLTTGVSGAGNGEATASKAPASTTTATPAPAATGSRSAQLAANGSGSAQASRDSAQVRGDASAQGSMSR
jgi:hypothetical protein